MIGYDSQTPRSLTLLVIADSSSLAKLANDAGETAWRNPICPCVHAGEGAVKWCFQDNVFIELYGVLCGWKVVGDQAMLGISI